jgi:hypothetical protein
VRVTFRKTGPRRYGVFVERDRAPVLAKDSAPGFDEHVPHDLLHFVAEAELGLDRRIFGDLAAGGNARIVIPVDKRLVARMWGAADQEAPSTRRTPLRAAGGRARTRVQEQPLPTGAGADRAEARRPAAERHALPVGGSLTLEWPRPERRRHGWIVLPRPNGS